ncbi:RASSF8 [Drosophila busckii]|uniref:RASSF8 n=1 Tax=Drosophila busckii TaxID=30019 RepID=A0A0M4EPY6_DROBS|nr:RASSF8 [Drosophila busckii]
MELKVWVEGIQRIVCGVTVNTTCQDVVFALAHATGKVGRFTLIERWRNNERHLAPNENPMKLLLKWGEYANDVQFILQRSENKQQATTAQQQQHQQQQQQSINNANNNNVYAVMATKKPLGLSNTNNESNVVQPPPTLQKQKSSVELSYRNKELKKSFGNQHIYSQLSKSSNELRRASPNELCYNNNNNNNSISNSSNEHICDIYANNNNNSPELYKQAPTISSNGALVPPPYRDPPPPRNSPMCQSQQRFPSSNAETISNASSSTNPFINDYEQHNNNNNSGSNSVNQCMDEGESMFQATQYNDLLQLIKFQREKITTQQMELQKFDTEIVFLESKERDHALELEAISREISKADQIFRKGSDQLQTLQYVEEENELVKQQEKTLKSEIALLRSKLANCETELLQCKNKMRLLMDDIELEQQSNRQTVERDFLMEMERIQTDIDQALHNTDTSNKTADSLKKELLMIEHAIVEKKRQVEQLVNEMKEVNLQSLTVTTTEEIKHMLEGQNKHSSRRIIGSPRQLETAVPTSKNPHGVWV